MVLGPAWKIHAFQLSYTGLTIKLMFSVPKWFLKEALLLNLALLKAMLMRETHRYDSIYRLVRMFPGGTVCFLRA